MHTLPAGRCQSTYYYVCTVQTDVDEKYPGTPNCAACMNAGRRRDQSNPGTRSPACYQVATGVLQRAARGSKLPEFWKSTRVPVLVVVQSCWNLILQGFNDRPSAIKPPPCQCITHFPHRPLSLMRSGRLLQQQDTPSSCLHFLLLLSPRLPACPGLCDPLIHLHPGSGL